jgi:hypothetical protein
MGEERNQMDSILGLTFRAIDIQQYVFTNLPYDAGSEPDPQIELMRITVNFEFETGGLWCHSSTLTSDQAYLSIG